MASIEGEFTIARPQKHSLRPLSESEQIQLKRLSRSTTAPVAQVVRAKALLSVAEGKSFARAARDCGQLSGDTVATWVIRFNREGISAVIPRHGGGARPRYGPQEKDRILEVARLVTKGEQDEPEPRSLKYLRQVLLEKGLPAPSTYTLWRILREADLDHDHRLPTGGGRAALNSPMAMGNPNELSKKKISRE